MAEPVRSDYSGMLCMVFLCCQEGPCVCAHLKWCINAYLTLQGYKALLSSPWYLNLGAYADEAWATYYKVEPLEFNAPPEQMQLVIGGEVRLATRLVQDFQGPSLHAMMLGLRLLRHLTVVVHAACTVYSEERREAS